jgi:membrane protease YdiL (CAAX protease family)
VAVTFFTSFSLPFSLPNMTEDFNDLQILIRVPTEVEATLIVQCLTGQNIAVQAVGAFTSGFAAEAPGDVSILVKRGDLARASSIMAKFRPAISSRRTVHDEMNELACSSESRANEEIMFACQECGEVITFSGERRGHVETCPHCEEYVDVPYENEKSQLSESKVAARDIMKRIHSDIRTTSQLWIEVLAILCLACIPDLFNSLTFVWCQPTPSYSFSNRELWFIVRSFQVSLPVLVIMALSKEPWSMFGIVRPKWIADLLGGCAMWPVGVLCSMYAIALLPSSLWGSGHYVSTGPVGIVQFFLLVLSCAANGFAEELVMRGYLLVRLERLLQSTLAAVLISTALFASYLLYQGVAGVNSAAAIGLFYAIMFCIFRRLWPLCLAHALTNFMQLI